MLGAKDKVFSRVKSLILTEDFSSLLKTRVKEGLKLYKTNPELIHLVSEYTGIDPDTLKEIWGNVYKLIIKLYYGQVKIKTKKSENCTVRLNTLANSIYYALYERYEHRAPEIMYSLLEPYIVSALQNPEDDEVVDKARLFFIPIMPENVDTVMASLREVMLSNKNILCDPAVVEALDIVCSQSSKLPSLRTASYRLSNMKDTKYCLELLRKTVSEVCKNE